MESKTKFYKTFLGEWFAVDPMAGSKHMVYYSRDGQNFWRLNVGGFSSSNSIVTTYSVESPHKGFNWNGKFKFVNNTFVLEIEDSPHRPIFRPTNAPVHFEKHPLPHITEIKGLFSLPDETFLFYTGARYDFDREGVKFYHGEIDNIQEYEVIGFDGYVLVTSIGSLTVHSCGFEGYRLEMLQHKEYEVEIDGKKIRLVHKK